MSGKLSFDRFARVDLRVLAVLAFLVPFLVRVLPEVLMGGSLVGFDTVGYYVPVASRWVGGGVDSLQAMAYAPLFYGLLVQLLSVGVPLIVSLKVLPPVLHGFLGLAVFGYARLGLLWSDRKSLLASFFAVLYFVGLRISWDMLRSELGLVFFFAFLLMLRRGWLKQFGWRFGAVLLAASLVVLSHQLVSVVMFAVVLVLALWKSVRRDLAGGFRLGLSVLPALILFAGVVYAGFVVSSGSGVMNSLLSESESGWFSLFGFSSYPEMISSELGFVLFAYLPVLPLALLGFRSYRNLELRVWSAWCVVAVLIGVVAGYRWILLMAFPLAFLAAEGFRRLRIRVVKLAYGGFLAFLSLSFVLLPAGWAFPYFGLYRYYVPSSMLQNSVPLGDCGDVAEALNWVDGRLGSDGVLLVHDAFHGWALMYLNDSSRVECYGYDDPQVLASGMSDEGYQSLFVVWWVRGEGWHGVASLPSCFVEVYRSNRIAVYEYVAS